MSIVTPGLLPRTLRNESLRILHASFPSLIYAARTNDGLIKIGVSTNLPDRLTHLKGGVVELLAIKPGDHSDELKIHRTLTGHAAEGREYYLPTPSVIKAVNAMRVPLGLEPYIPPRRWS